MLEKCQEERIALMQSILPYFGDNFILKGGSALILYYGLNRYSRDLYFDSISNTMNFINRLKTHKDFKKWEISIKKNTPVVFRAMINYGAKSHLGDYPLKVEVSNRNKILLQNNTLKYHKDNGVNIYDTGELIKMKVAAFSGRDKIRDFYDLGFLVEKYEKFFNKDLLFAIHEKISYFGIEELDLLLKDEIEKHHLVTYDNLLLIGNYTQKFLTQIEQMLKSLSQVQKNSFMAQNDEDGGNGVPPSRGGGKKKQT